MKNIGIKTKKFVRKITAIASAALMAGLSMGAAAADLSSLSSTFIQNGEFKAYVVVGTGGQSNVVGFAQDVAGSIVVASAFAQQATTSAATSGTAVLARNLSTGYVGIGGVLNISEYGNKTWTNSDSGFSWIPNSTVVNSSGDSVANVTGTLSLKRNFFYLNNDGTYVLSNKGIVYNITFNSDKTTSGNKAITNYTSGIPFPDGKAYQITNWTASGSDVNASLGDYTEVSNLAIGTPVVLGDSGVTFVINDVDVSSSTHMPQVLVTDSVGNKIVNNESWSVGKTYENSTLGIALHLKEWKETTAGKYAKIEWSTSSTKLVSGQVNSKWPNWTIYLSTDSLTTPTGVTSIAWEYSQLTPGTFIKIPQGSSVSMLDGFFKISGEPLVINSTNMKIASITVSDATGSAADVSFVDENNTAHAIDLNVRPGQFSADQNQTNINNMFDTSWLVLCDYSNGKVNLTNQGTGKTVVLTNGSPFTLNRLNGNVTGYSASVTVVYGGPVGCSGATFNLSVNSFTSDAGNPINTSLAWVATASDVSNINGTLTLTEPATGSPIVFTYLNGDISSTGVTVGTPGQTQISSVGDAYYTSNWGTLLTRDSSSSISVVLPEARRIGKASVGRTGEQTFNLTAGSYNSDLDVTLKSSAGTSQTVNAIDVNLAKLDSEVTTASLDRPIVLMGGSAVNSLVSTLVSNGMVDFSDLSSDRALVQLVSNAFNSQSALVIAGWAGQDTRLAAEVVASQVLGKLSILSGSRDVLNTGVTSYTGVTVV